MKVWEGKQVIGFLLTWRLLRPQLQQQTTDKYIVLSQLHKMRLFNQKYIHNFASPMYLPICVSIVLAHISGFVSRSQEKSDPNQLRSFEGQMLQ